MGSKKIKRKNIKNSRSPYQFVIRLVLLVLCSYLMIQVSIEAKRIEEKDYLPDMQTTMDYLDKYVRYRYKYDWDRLGHNLWRDDDTLYEIFFKRDKRIVKAMVNKGTFDFEKVLLGFMFPVNEYQYLLRESIDCGNHELALWIAYNGDPHIHLSLETGQYHAGGEFYRQFNIQYENGLYILNKDFEEQTGITTEEAVIWAEDVRQIFEEEVERMHVYEVNKSRKTRCRFANGGLFIFFCYIVWKWLAAGRKAKAESKLMEQCVGEITANTMGKWLKWKYLLLGGSITFWIYMLRPIFSRFILFWINGIANIYAAYALSATTTIVVIFVLYRKVKKREYTERDRGKAAWFIKKILQLVQLATGCGVMLFFINLSRMYDFLLRALGR